MYIDSMTIAAALLFAIVFAVFIRGCIFRACGLQGRQHPADGDRQ